MSTKIVYQCDNNWIFQQEALAYESPLEQGVYHIPRGCVEVKPNIPDGHIARWDTANSEWEYLENHIGAVVYNTTTKVSMIISDYGPIPAGFTSRIPSEFSVWDGQLWVIDKPARLAVLKQRKLAEINADLELALSTIRSEYPDSEVMSWTKQESEARYWSADNNAPTPLLDLISTIRGIDKAELVGKVLLKADQYSYAVGLAVGRRQLLETQILSITVGQEKQLAEIKF